MGEGRGKKCKKKGVGLLKKWANPKRSGRLSL
jgi:hypothetical protein